MFNNPAAQPVPSSCRQGGRHRAATSRRQAPQAVAGCGVSSALALASRKEAASSTCSSSAAGGPGDQSWMCRGQAWHCRAALGCPLPSPGPPTRHLRQHLGHQLVLLLPQVLDEQIHHLQGRGRGEGCMVGSSRRGRPGTRQRQQRQPSRACTSAASWVPALRSASHLLDGAGQLLAALLQARRHSSRQCVSRRARHAAH